MYKTWSYVLFNQKSNMQVFGLKKIYVKDKRIAYKKYLIPISNRKDIRPRKSRVNPSLFNIKYVRGFRCAETNGVIAFKITAIVAEWLRRWTRNPMGSARAGSNPADCEYFFAKL